MSECDPNTYLKIRRIHLQHPEPGAGLEAVGGAHHATLLVLMIIVINIIFYRKVKSQAYQVPTDSTIHVLGYDGPTLPHPEPLHAGLLELAHSQDVCHGDLLPRQVTRPAPEQHPLKVIQPSLLQSPMCCQQFQ